MVGIVHHPNQPIHQIRHVTETAGLGAVSINGQGLATQGLHNEVADHAPIVFQHPSSVGVENTHHADVYAVLAVIVKGEGFGNPFAFVVATADPDRVDVAPIVFALGMDFWIAVDFGGGGQQEPGFDPFGQAQHVHGPDRVGFNGFDGIVLVVHRRGRTGQVINLIHFQPNSFGNIVADEFKVRVAQPVNDVALVAGVEIVEANDLMTGVH